jgi:uncharacterized protein DUF1573
MRKQTHTGILILSLAWIVTGICSCQQDKQKVPEPDNVITTNPKTVAEITDGTKTTIPKTAAQRLEEQRNQAKTQKPPRRKDAGHLTADKLVHDYGLAEPRARLQAKFVLNNDGKETLKIRSVRTSCSCLASKLKTKTLEPGQTVPLTLTFSTPGSAGKVTKTATITTEPPAAPEVLQLKVTAQVKQYVEVTPKRLEINLHAKEPDLPPLVLKSTDNKPFQIISARVSNNSLDLVYDKKKAATRHSITLKPNLVSLNKTPHGGMITMQVNHPNVKSLTASYRVVLPYAAHPSVRRFTAAKPGQPAQAQIDIVSNYTEPFELGEMKSEKGLVKVLKTEKQPKGYKLFLEMTVPPNNKQRMPSDYLNVKIKENPNHSLRILCYALNR